MQSICCSLFRKIAREEWKLPIREGKTAKRYQEPEECRIYKNIKGRPKARAYYPILEWTLEDVAEFIAERNIKCAPVYYDEQGVFHPERRLGCMGCLLMSQKKRKEQINKCEPLNKNKILLEVPTVSGIHLITSPFNSSKFKLLYPNINIHKDCLTFLYYNNEN